MPLDMDDVDPAPRTEVTGYIVVTDLAPGTTAEDMFRARMAASGASENAAMLVVDEGRNGGQPKAWLNAVVTADGFGMLQWGEASGRRPSYLVPSSRHNEEREGWVQVLHPTGIRIPLSTQMRCPLPLLYQAVDETIATGTKPSCVEWVAMTQPRTIYTGT